MSVVTLSQAKAHLEVIGDDQDDKIQGYIDAAERYAEQFMGRELGPWEEPDSSSSEPPVPADVVQAILLLVADFYEHREAAFVGTIYTRNPAAESLMHFHRKGLGV